MKKLVQNREAGHKQHSKDVQGLNGKRTLIYILRLSILALVLLPVLIPYVQAKLYHVSTEKINIYVDSVLPSAIEQIELKKEIKSKFGNNIKLNYIIYGNIKNTNMQDYEELIHKINQSNETCVIVSDAHFFGEETEKFTNVLKLTRANKEKRLYFLNIASLTKNKVNESYIAISSIFLPKTIFINNSTFSIVTIIGKAKPNSKLHLNLELKSGPSFINAKEINIQVPKSGFIKEILEVPVQFVKIGTQSIIASISSYPEIATFPLNTAFTTVQVTYSKTNILHVAFAPDWSLRLFRWKLKFWPNLNLLSYYILREMNSDQSIRGSELSLIEFPSEKLFGSELANLHGILAQNFIFGNYLGEQETQNLVQYVKDGGRLVIQSGAYSFSDNNQIISQLYPCVNKPILDTKNVYNWIANSDNISLSTHNIKTFNHILSHSTFTKCIPKENTIVLARLKETHDPVLIAMPLQKGIIVSFLASDWLSSYTSLSGNSLIQNLSRMEYANASDSLFQWMVEFLQRKQDSGMRAPEFAGPRLYSEDSSISLKTNGGLNLKQDLLVQAQNGEKLQATPFVLKNLNVEMLKLHKPLKDIINSTESNSPLNLQELTMNPKEQSSQLLRFKSVPVFHGSGKNLENKSNPFLFEGIPTLSKLNKNLVKYEKNDQLLTKKTPLLISYPWLLVLALGLLCLEQFLIRIRNWL